MEPCALEEVEVLAEALSRRRGGQNVEQTVQVDSDTGSGDDHGAMRSA